MKFLLVFLIKIYFFKTSTAQPQSTPEYYSSTDKLQDLFKLETERILLLRDIISEMYETIDFIEQIYDSWVDEHTNAENNVEKYVSNPLNAFLIIKRNAIDVKSIQNKLKTFLNVFNEKQNRFDAEKVLSYDEVVGATAGILRLQKTYHLKSEDLVAGVIEGEQTRKPLTSDEILLLADESFSQRGQEFFAKSYYEILQNHQLNESSKAEINKRLEILNKDPIEDPFNDDFEDVDIGNGNANRIITRIACRGDFQRSPHVTKNLHCKFVSFSHFSWISPFKLEEISFEPFIVIYHGIISDNEINTVIELAKPQRAKAMVGLDKGEIASQDRLAQNAWLYKRDHEVIARITRRFEDMTGLTMETAEPLQVQNYGVGGQYNGHFDIDVSREEFMNERIATLMIYLSEVEKQGATVFPYIKLRVNPEKGSAIFWYNLLHSGHKDFLTYHSGCPVLLGSKWVANKWISKRKQEFKRKCKAGNFKLKAQEAIISETFFSS